MSLWIYSYMLFIEHVFIKVHHQSYMDIISLHRTCRAGGTKSGHSFIMATRSGHSIIMATKSGHSIIMATKSGHSFIMAGGHNDRVYTVRESQGKGSLLLWSGKVREACNGQGQNSIFILQVREIFHFSP